MHTRCIMHTRCPAGAGKGDTLHLCYLRHAFGLGEHYNSVQPLPSMAENGQREDDPKLQTEEAEEAER